MVREFKVAITIFSNIQRLSQSSKLQEKISVWGGLTFVRVGPSIFKQRNQTRKKKGWGGSETLSASLMEVNSGT